MTIRKVTLNDDLNAICAQMQPGAWGKDNEMTSYDPEALRKFLENGDVLILAYEGERIAGAGLASIILHPSKNADTLFINEIDTHPDFRRQGIATLLMTELFKIAEGLGLSEAWVGADEGNEPAHNLYKKLGPTGLDPNTIYDYKIPYHHVSA